MSTMTMSPTTSPAAGAATGTSTRPAAPARSSVRLTRRGRLVVFLVALGAVLCLGLVLGAAGSVASERPGTPEPTRVVMVGSGDTLWGIAAEVAEDGDVRAMVHELERLNALDSALLQAGQRLRVPAGD